MLSDLLYQDFILSILKRGNLLGILSNVHYYLSTELNIQPKNGKYAKKAILKKKA